MKKIVFIIVGLIIIAGIVCWVRNYATGPSENSSPIVYSSQSECENATGGKCSFQMCDYIPGGKTFEEVCGKDFKKGWVESR